MMLSFQSFFTNASSDKSTGKGKDDSKTKTSSSAKTDAKSTSKKPSGKPLTSGHSISKALHDAIETLNKTIKSEKLSSEVKPYLEQAKKILEQSL